jgi:hypothetical protein
MLNCTVYVEESEIGITGRDPVVIPSASVRLRENNELFDRINRLGPKELPGDLMIVAYGEQEIRTDEDGYSEQLLYLRGSDLRKLVAPREAGAWNKFAVKMLSSLPKEAVAVLYWD